MLAFQSHLELYFIFECVVSQSEYVNYCKNHYLRENLQLVWITLNKKSKRTARFSQF